jgi:hypothetical protein
MWVAFLLLLLLLPLPLSVHAEDLGELSANPAGLFSFSGYLVSLVLQSAHQMNETNQTNKINQFRPFSPYGSPFSNQSATNPYATDAPRLYDQQGHYRGKLSANPAV